METFEPSVDHIVLVGRGRESGGEQLDRLVPVDDSCYTVCPMPEWEGMSFLRFLPVIIPRLVGVIRDCDGLLLKLFYVHSVLAYFLNLVTYRKKVAAYLVGDAPAAFIMRSDIVRGGRLRALGARFVGWLIRRILATADVAATVSKHLHERYAPQRPVVVANESWIEERHFWMRPPGQYRNTILFVGRLVKSKGLLQLVEALHLLRRQGIDFQCVIVGDGPLRGQLIERVEELGLGDRVRMVGWLRPLSEELRDCYKQADILCLPSYAEGLPLVLIEAMAHGVAVLATDVGGIPDLVEHEKNGLLVRPGDAQQLARELTRLLTDHDLRTRCARNGYETAKANTYWGQRRKLGLAVARMLENPQ